MGKTQGFNKYVCDKCGLTEYAKDGSPSVRLWRNVHHYNIDGVVIDRLLCTDCTQAYRKLALNSDNEFNKFMNSGGKK